MEKSILLQERKELAQNAMDALEKGIFLFQNISQCNPKCNSLKCKEDSTNNQVLDNLNK